MRINIAELQSLQKNRDSIRSIFSFKTNSHKQFKSLNIKNKTESKPKIMAETFNFVLLTFNLTW